MTLDQAIERIRQSQIFFTEDQIKQLDAAIAAARNREDVAFFDNETNIKEMLMDFKCRVELIRMDEYIDQTKRKA